MSSAKELTPYMCCCCNKGFKNLRGFKLHMKTKTHKKRKKEIDEKVIDISEGLEELNPEKTDKRIKMLKLENVEYCAINAIMCFLKDKGGYDAIALFHLKKEEELMKNKDMIKGDAYITFYKPVKIALRLENIKDLDTARFVADLLSYGGVNCSLMYLNMNGEEEGGNMVILGLLSGKVKYE